MSDQEPDTDPGEEASGNSIWDDLKRQHAQASGGVDPYYLPIPTYTGVVARYRYVPLDETKRATNRAQGIRDITDLAVVSAVDTILLALDELMVVNRAGTIPTGKNGQTLFELPLVGLGNPGEPPLKFDEVLAERMGFKLGDKATAAQILRRFFANDDRTILDHAGDLGVWTNTARRAVSEELAGG